MTEGRRPIAAAGGGAGGWPACLRRCCCRVNVTLFSRVTLIRKPQSTSYVDYFHALELPCSRVKSSDDLISDRREDSGVLYSFICRDCTRACYCTSCLVGLCATVDFVTYATYSTPYWQITFT